MPGEAVPLSVVDSASGAALLTAAWATVRPGGLREAEELHADVAGEGEHDQGQDGRHEEAPA